MKPRFHPRSKVLAAFAVRLAILITDPCFTTCSLCAWACFVTSLNLNFPISKIGVRVAILSFSQLVEGDKNFGGVLGLVARINEKLKGSAQF